MVAAAHAKRQGAKAEQLAARATLEAQIQADNTALFAAKQAVQQLARRGQSEAGDIARAEVARLQRSRMHARKVCSLQYCRYTLITVVSRPVVLLC